MPKKTHIVALTVDRRRMLAGIVSSRKSSAKAIRRANVILALDTAGGRKPMTTVECAKAFRLCTASV